MPPHEEPDDDYPFWLTTGRVVYHFHTRTKTGRARRCSAAAPDAFVQIARGGRRAARRRRRRHGRGHLAPRRGARRRPGSATSMPGTSSSRSTTATGTSPADARAANELTITGWDPVSKQPHFKFAAVTAREERGRRAPPSPRTWPPRATARACCRQWATPRRRRSRRLEVAVAPPRAHVADYLGLLLASEEMLADAFETR